MSIMQNFGLVGALDNSQLRQLITEAKVEIRLNTAAKKTFKTILKEQKATERAEKRQAQIAKLQAKIEALSNPVGAKAIKANRKAGAVKVFDAEGVEIANQLSKKFAAKKIA